MNIYLGPSTPRWEPTSESDLRLAISNGIITENHFVELKSTLDRGPHANMELARDLAQFAVDSGVLIFGIKEHANNTLTLTPVVLDGLAERIEQVARSIPDPLLPITSFEIPSDNDPALGFLFVKVPKTGTAPHMVDGVYFGRGDKMKIRLSNSDVTRLHEEQIRARVESNSRIVDALRRNPIPEHLRRQAHFFVIATPVVVAPGAAKNLVSSDDWREKLTAIVSRATTLVEFDQNQTGPLSDLQNWQVRSNGVAVVSPHFQNGRTIKEDGHGIEDASEIEFFESGEVRIFIGCLSQTARTARNGVPFPKQEIIDDFAPMLVRAVLSIISDVAHQTGINGEWSISVAAVGIAGLPAYGGSLSTPKFDIHENEYRRTVVTSVEEIDQAPGRITSELVGGFIRALGRENKYNANYFNDAFPQSSQ